MSKLYSPRFWCCFLGLITATMIAASGCSKGVKKVTVNGTVSYKGQPVQSGILQFVGADGGSYSAATIQAGGKYTMTDVVPGEVKIAIQEAPGSSGSSGGSSEKGPKAAPVNLPDKVRNAETSGLKYTITPETAELNIEIPG